MKKMILSGVFGTLIIAAVAFSGFSVQPSSLNQLRAEATSYCTPDSHSDCQSTATENIYAGYRAVNP